MICRGCGNEAAYQIHTIYDKEIGMIDCCDRCGDLRSIDASVPDVFWYGRPYYSEALDCQFTSRSQKARVMKEKNVTELGNEKIPVRTWTDGSRNYRKRMFDKIDRPRIREIYKQYLEKRKH